MNKPWRADGFSRTRPSSDTGRPPSTNRCLLPSSAGRDSRLRTHRVGHPSRLRVATGPRGFSCLQLRSWGSTPGSMPSSEPSELKAPFYSKEVEPPPQSMLEVLPSLPAAKVCSLPIVQRWRDGEEARPAEGLGGY